MSYMNFAMGVGEISTTIGTRSSRVIKLPNGVCIYRVELYNGLDVILMSEPRKAVAHRRYEQDIYFFDKVVHMAYRGMFNILLSLVQGCSKHSVFAVDAVTSDGRISIGTLCVHSDGKIYYNKEPVRDNMIRILYAKSLMLA